MENIIFLIGIVIFSLSSITFFMLKHKNSEIASLNLIVNFVTVVSYLLMMSGIFVFPASNGENIYWTRWVFYVISCSFLMGEISTILKIKIKAMIEIIVFNAIVMITGLLASITTGIDKWLFFIISAIAYIYNLYLIRKHQGTNRMLVNFVYIFWSGFPVIWLLSPAGLLVINAFWTAILYLLLDITTKIYFGYMTVKKYPIH